MDLNKFDVILDINDNDFSEKLAEALELKPGEKLEITTPQFTRVGGRAIHYRPASPEEYKALHKLDSDSLKKIGCQKWGNITDDPTSDVDPNAPQLWLFPYEWYDSIPDGTKIIDIFGTEEAFEKGKTDDDMRFGALAFGFIQQVN